MLTAEDPVGRLTDNELVTCRWAPSYPNYACTDFTHLYTSNERLVRPLSIQQKQWWVREGAHQNCAAAKGSAGIIDPLRNYRGEKALLEILQRPNHDRRENKRKPPFLSACKSS